MGLCSSSVDDYFIPDLYHQIPRLAEFKTLYDTLGLSQTDVSKLFNHFCAIDKDESDSIDVDEFLNHINLENTKYGKSCFLTFDDDNSGAISFKEFVLSLWNYCTLTKASLILFAFDMYDKDHSGSITYKEMLGILKDLYGSDFRQNRHAKKVALEIDAMGKLDGDVNIDDFREYCTRHASLLFAAFQMQEAIRVRILGNGFWERLANKRLKLSGKKDYLTVTDILRMHVDSHLHKKILQKSTKPSKGEGGRARALRSAHEKTSKAQTVTVDPGHAHSHPHPVGHHAAGAHGGGAHHRKSISADARLAREAREAKEHKSPTHHAHGGTDHHKTSISAYSHGDHSHGGGGKVRRGSKIAVDESTGEVDAVALSNALQATGARGYRGAGDQHDHKGESWEGNYHGHGEMMNRVHDEYYDKGLRENRENMLKFHGTHWSHNEEGHYEKERKVDYSGHNLIGKVKPVGGNTETGGDDSDDDDGAWMTKKGKDGNAHKKAGKGQDRQTHEGKRRLGDAIFGS